MMLRTFVLALLVALAGCGHDGERSSVAAGHAAETAADDGSGTGVAPFSKSTLEADRTIAGGDMHDVVAELASDAYGGRGPGTDGGEKARDYLTRRLRSLGYAPGAGDGYQQPFTLVGVDARQPATWTFDRGAEHRQYRQGSDFIVASGVQQATAALDQAELVFVGYGIQAPEYQWDDFGEADLKGKVLVMLNNDPDWDPDLFEGERRLYYGRWTYKYESAARQGAAGAIIIHTTPSAGYPWQVVQSSWSGPQFELPQGDEPRLQVKGWLSHDAAADLVKWSGHDLDELTEAARHRDFTPMPLGVTTSLTLNNTLRRVQSANVLGLRKGRDPELSKQVVIFTAHFDHLGIDPDTTRKDRIYNGALDNASGDAVVLSIAKAVQALPEAPRRSILIAFVGAEEQGLLGSKYYAEHPTFPAGRIAADINFDGASIWGRTRDVGYIGLGKSDLDRVARTVARFQGRTLTGDQDPSKGHYYRSDQFSFARIGVPAIYPKAGRDVIGKPPGWGKEQIDAYTAHNYHQVSDELTDDWDFSGMVQDAEFGFLAGMLIANDDHMPQWQPGDEFADARAAALKAVADDPGS